ncbi:hypothetical protein Tco_1323755, partial [Tanacetum coccineum]
DKHASIAIVGDTSRTKSYIPKVSEIPGFSPVLAQFYKPIENHCIHEGRVVDQLYYKSNEIERLFTNVRFDSLFDINEPIVPRFTLDFYSQVKVQTDEYDYLLISFVIQHEFISLSLTQFSQIIRIPYNGQAVFTNEWDLASLAFFQETERPYHTNLPTPDDIRRFFQLKRVESNRTIKSKNVILTPNQILIKELRKDMKRWEELIRKNVFGLGGHRDHLSASLAHMLYCIVTEEQYNLVYFFVKLIECARATPNANLPYDMFLTLLSPSAPNAPPKTPSVVATSPSSIDYKPKSPISSTSPSTHSYLNSSMSPPPRVPPPPPTQESGSMDITLTLLPITPLGVQFNTPSPPLSLFGHPIPWNILEAHGDSCLCCIHNRTLIFGLRDELQYMFSYIEHMLSQPPPQNSPPPPSLSPY